jgi:glucosamine-6-phosphate deaminase
LPIYQALARHAVSAFSEVQLFALDEYVGLPPTDPRSYRRVVLREVAEPLGIHPDRVHVPDGGSRDLATAGDRYEAAIANAGGIDLQILGIGTTGHIGFNEPGSSLRSRTRVKTLAPKTRADNARFFDSIDDVPRHCVTQGVGTILDAARLLLVAAGESKADAVAAALEGPLTSMCPGSAIQLHPDATVVLDHDAAHRLTLLDYHRSTHDNRPGWQEF